MLKHAKNIEDSDALDFDTFLSVVILTMIPSFPPLKFGQVKVNVPSGARAILSGIGQYSGKDIKSFVFGGFSSRFWMMRKHIN